MAARTRKTRCAYCRALLEEGRRSDAEYCDSSCRGRASEKRKSRQRAKLRKVGAQKRSRAAQTRRKPELRVSYRKALAEVAALLRDDGFQYEVAQQIASDTLAPCLTDRQRAAL